MEFADFDRCPNRLDIDQLEKICSDMLQTAHGYFGNTFLALPISSYYASLSMEEAHDDGETKNEFGTEYEFNVTVDFDGDTGMYRPTKYEVAVTESSPAGIKDLLQAVCTSYIIEPHYLNTEVAIVCYFSNAEGGIILTPYDVDDLAWELMSKRERKTFDRIIQNSFSQIGEDHLPQIYDCLSVFGFVDPFDQ